ncbi:MAG: shikimate dehydrogenase [Salinibacterium sp.]|nr:shikimate dehydrogenase [Salinibacterium sp.]
MDSARSKLAVLGSPISHSKSPQIQRAAYGVLGVDWQYEAIDITGEDLPDFMASRGDDWRGLSLTMPLKREVIPLLDWRAPLVDLVGGANTVLFTASGVRGFNTDVYGVQRSFREAGVASLAVVHVLGSGATAASVIAGVAGLGATQVVLAARNPAKAGPLVTLGDELEIEVTVVPWGVPDGTADAVVSTLPGGENDLVFSESVRRASVLFDVAYDPWPSELARQWTDAGGTVISGIELLLNQAVGQVRIFVAGDPDLELHNEDAVVAAMRASVWEY